MTRESQLNNFMDKRHSLWIPGGGRQQSCTTSRRMTNTPLLQTVDYSISPKEMLRHSYAALGKER